MHSMLHSIILLFLLKNLALTILSTDTYSSIAERRTSRKTHVQNDNVGASVKGKKTEPSDRENHGRGKRESVGIPQPPGVILLDDTTGVRGQVLLTPLISSALHAAEYRAQKRELSKYPGWLRPFLRKEPRSIPA